MLVKKLGPRSEVNHCKGLCKKVRVNMKNFVKLKKIDGRKPFKDVFELIKGGFVFR